MTVDLDSDPVVDILDDAVSALEELEQKARYELMELGLSANKAKAIINKRISQFSRISQISQF